MDLERHFKKQIKRLKTEKSYSKIGQEKEFLALLENLDSIAYQRTRKRQKSILENGKIIKDFNKAESELYSKVYLSSLKAKLSLLATQLETE